MDSNFFRAIYSAIANKHQSYCVLNVGGVTTLFYNQISYYSTITDLNDPCFVTGWQNHDGLSGSWIKWESKETFEASGPTQMFLDLEIENKSPFTSDLSKDEYIQKIVEMQNDMRKGEYYLANLTRSVESDASIDPVYIALMSCIYHPTPNRFFYHSPTFSILGLSPETFLKIDLDKISCEPMKGTHVDIETLQNNQKEFEESTMMIDLCRSELSKVCIPQSIELKEKNSISAHPGLFQMSNTITGTLTGNKRLSEVITELMPIASVTGTPKPYVVKKLALQEKEPRGIYCGTYGFVDTKTQFSELAVAIRTIEFRKNKTKIGAGAGITIRSNAEQEWNETELKLEKIKSLCSLSKSSTRQGIFTSTAVMDGKVFRLKAHCERLSTNANAAGMNINTKELSDQAEEFVANSNISNLSRLRISIKNEIIDCELQSVANKQDPLDIGIAFFGKDAHVQLIPKTFDRDIYDKAMQQAQLCTSVELDDTLLTIGNQVIESTRANIFARISDKIITPKHPQALLGVFQDYILESCSDLFNFEIRCLDIDELISCDELILTNSVRGPMQVRSISNSILDFDKSFDCKDSQLFGKLSDAFYKGFN